VLAPPLLDVYEGDELLRYEAVASIHHLGKSASSGHYYAYARCARGGLLDWWKLNDAPKKEKVTMSPQPRSSSL
jgi:hypothetical protein